MTGIYETPRVDESTQETKESMEVAIDLYLDQGLVPPDAVIEIYNQTLRKIAGTILVMQ